MNLLKNPKTMEAGGMAAIFGHLFLRLSAGDHDFLYSWFAQIGRLDWLRSTRHALGIGRRSAGMRLPAPLAPAGVATLVQFNCSLFVVVAWFTRITLALLVCALSGVILQNLLIGRDPQLAIFYTLGCRDARLHGWWKIFTLMQEHHQKLKNNNHWKKVCPQTITQSIRKPQTFIMKPTRAVVQLTVCQHSSADALTNSLKHAVVIQVMNWTTG